MLAEWRRAGIVLPTLMTIAALPVLLGLGTWQMQRKVWKDGLIAAIELRAGAPPEVIDGLRRATPDWEYRRVRISGRFDHTNERHLFAHDPRYGPGYHVYTPLLTEAGGPVLVNRGYVPASLKEPAAREAGLVTGRVDVVGLVRSAEVRGLFSPKPDPAKNVWFWRDVAGMLGVPPSGYGGPAAAYSVDAEAEPINPGGWPRGGTTNLRLPNRHLEYALTWYGLAATLVIVFLVFARGRLRAVKPRTQLL